MLGDDYEPLPTGDALRRHWQAQLPEGERKVFDVICEEYPRGLQRGDLHELTGYKRSSANTYVQRLAARGLIAAHGGELYASEALFG